jgi:hypothetical protein
MLKALVRLFGIAALLAFTLLRLWLAWTGVAAWLGPIPAAAVSVVLIWFGFRLPLQIAAFLAAVLIWRWPVLLALIIAAPRLFLVLPGLVSTYLAQRRHPRPRWVAAAQSVR